MDRLQDRIILGDNPFIGVDHLDQSRRKENPAEKVAETIKAAYDAGATAFTFSTHDMMHHVLKELFEQGFAPKLGYYPLHPYANKYVRMVTERGAAGLAEDTLSKVGVLGAFKGGAMAGLGFLTKDPYKIFNAFTKLELDPFVELLGTRNIRAAFLHEIIVDVCLGLDIKHVLENYAAYINDNYHTKAGFVTRNFPLFVRKMKDWEIEADVIMTPFNGAGFQMTPTKEECEAALSALPSSTGVVAISPMAAGLLKPADAFGYIKNFPRIDAVAVGTSKPWHARETISAAKQVLG